MESMFPRKKHSTAAHTVKTDILRAKIKPIRNNTHTALMPYIDLTVKNFIYAIKYEKHKKSIRLAATILGEYLYDEIQEQEAIQKMNYILCTVPATRERKNKNGYDHMHSILNELYKKISGNNIKYEKSLLLWTRHTQRQSRLKNRRERIKNMHRAMKTKKPIPPNTICFVIDDVTTTGATLTEAQRTLIEGGTNTVITLALAH